MMRPPNTISSRFEIALSGMCRPMLLSRKRTVTLSSTGNSVMNALPRNDPSTVPTPPMITMNKMRNDRSRL